MNASQTLFLYGTLRHLPLLTIVAGRPVDPRPARLPGHAVFTVDGADYPIIRSAPGEVAEGLILTCDDEMRARLDFYEAGFGYELREVTAETDAGPERVFVYFAVSDGMRPGPRWSLAAWARDWSPLALIAAHESMDRFGDWDAAGLARRWPPMRARAWSRLLAANPAPATLRTDPAPGAVEVRGVTRRHTGFFALDELELDHATFAGGRSGPIRREAFVGMDAALVLPYDPATDRVLVVEQVRTGPIRRGDPRPWTLEPVAGLVDAGEAPEDTARREAMEEAGLVFRHLEPVLKGYPSPGATTEFYHCFVGLCALDDSHAGGPGGLGHEAEDIRAHVLDRARAMDLVSTGEVNVIPLAMLLLWVGANRHRLAALP
ncbi:gamma-glutamylcyclotransferase [Palleronia sp. KMU-117]|uniref:gamma-glutamylcyclotransferase n=1 Tax=Palleronia sp. KMU-117 TaxID=3434108 RepID=UPI003D72904D